MSDASETLAGDLERVFEEIARAVGEVSPGNDVFEPRGPVHRWLAGLDPKDSGRFLMLLSSEQWEAELASIARCDPPRGAGRGADAPRGPPGTRR